MKYQFKRLTCEIDNIVLVNMILQMCQGEKFALSGFTMLFT